MLFCIRVLSQDVRARRPIALDPSVKVEPMDDSVSDASDLPGTLQRTLHFGVRPDRTGHNAPLRPLLEETSLWLEYMPTFWELMRLKSMRW
jgi:hypothetical protein